jgi:hypothetical protein
VLENQEASSIYDSPQAPYFNRLRQYGVTLKAMYGVGHASLPNYIAMISGHTPVPNTQNDCYQYNCVYHSVPDADLYTGNADYNLADQLEGTGLTWKGYMDSMPLPCTHPPLEGGGDIYQAPYADRHNPFIYFSNIKDNSGRCNSHVVPYGQLAQDLSTNTVPSYAFITPDTCHDGHDSPCYPPYPPQPSGIPMADQWLSQNLPAIFKSQAFRDQGVVFITWDEGSTSAGCCGNATGGNIATLVLSEFAMPGATSTVAYSHYSVLLTVERSFGLGCLRHACDSGTQPLGSDVWFTPPPGSSGLPFTSSDSTAPVFLFVVLIFLVGVGMLKARKRPVV